MIDASPTPASPSADDVRRVLAGVVDPELHVSITELGMVKDVAIRDGAIDVTVALTTAGCPLRHQIQREIQSKVSGLPGVEQVEVTYGELTPDERQIVMQRARKRASERAPQTAVSPTTRVLAVASGKGGVGKSSITANLAAALALRGLTVGVLDADIWGFSVPRMLGVSGRLRASLGSDAPRGPRAAAPAAGTAAADTAETTDAADAADAGPKAQIEPQEVVVGDGHLRVVSMGLLVDDEDTALMWRGLILSKALEQFLVDVRWGDLDYLLIDMPPGTGDIQMALARLLPQTELLVVTTPGVNAQKVAARVADMARRSYLKVAGIVENMSEFVAPDGSRHAIFGRGGGERLARLTGAPVLARIPIEPAVSDGADAGRPVVVSHPDAPAAGALRDLAARLVTEVLPPVEMAGCTARILELAQQALG